MIDTSKRLQSADGIADRHLMSLVRATLSQAHSRVPRTERRLSRPPPHSAPPNMSSLKPKRLRSLVSILVVALCTTSCHVFDGDPAPFELNIAHVNDHHSNIRPFETTLVVDGISTTVEIGGFARLATLFKQAAATTPNLLKLHAGDAITGTPYYTFFDGETDALAMNAICFDVFIPGNHEFDDGDAALKKFLDMLASDPTCKTPVLAANIRPAAGTPLAQRPDGSPYFQPYLIRHVGGIPVGIIGIDVKGKTQNASRPLPTTVFDDETEAAQRTIDQLKTLGIRHIVLMTHIGYQPDLALAARLTDVDVIIGGDSHTLLGEFSEVGFAEPQGTYPTVVRNKSGELVCIGQAFEYAKVFAQMRVVFNLDGSVQSCDGTASLVIGTTFKRNKQPLSAQESAAFEARLARIKGVRVAADDTEVASRLARFETDYSARTQTVIGTLGAADSLCLVREPGSANRGGALCDGVETRARGADISQVVAEAFRQAYGGGIAQFPSAHFGLVNAGGVRVPIESDGVSPRILRNQDAYLVQPFPNELFSIRITGAEIASALEEGVANWLDNRNSNGSHPYASGLRWNLDLTQPRGQRFTGIEVKDPNTGSWSAVQANQTYLGILTDYLTQGFEGYDTLKRICTGAGDRCATAGSLFADQSLINYVKKIAATPAPNNMVMRPVCGDYAHQRVRTPAGLDLQPCP